jgi:hypothetical protein
MRRDCRKFFPRDISELVIYVGGQELADFGPTPAVTKSKVMGLLVVVLRDY